MSLKQIDLTTALRPSLLPDEVLLFVQDNVGLYEGKYKIPNFQNGHAYLTSHRVCYVDNEEPRKNSVGIDLKDVERYEFYAGFLKSSAKITLVPKPNKRSAHNKNISALNSSPSGSAAASPTSRTASPFHLPPAEPTRSNGTWICPICTFSNPVPSNFDPAIATAQTPLPPCLACGIKPPLSLVMKAAISNASNRPLPASVPLQSPMPLRNRETVAFPPDRPFNQCPRCTFSNHPSLVSCELCGAHLQSRDVPSEFTNPPVREESPGPTLWSLPLAAGDDAESIKLSFRGGGEKIFHERLKGAMVQRKWLLQGAPPVPRPTRNFGGDSFPGSNASSFPAERVKAVGIAGLEQHRSEMRKNNELVIGNAFQDLEALMASAKELADLAQSLARQSRDPNSNNGTETNALLAESASALGLVTTKDMLGGGSSSETLYLSELSRNLAELLTDDARGVLKNAGGIISLVDLWAMFNRARGGVELVSPTDFASAARLWEKLKLPVRLRQFKSGLLVVQGRDRSDEKTVRSILQWLKDLQTVQPEREVGWDWQVYGRGVTAQDAADHFGWSIGVANEELEMAEERGDLCREESIEGLRFWVNWLVRYDNDGFFLLDEVSR